MEMYASATVFIVGIDIFIIIMMVDILKEVDTKIHGSLPVKYSGWAITVSAISIFLHTVAQGWFLLSNGDIPDIGRILAGLWVFDIFLHILIGELCGMGAQAKQLFEKFTESEKDKKKNNNSEEDNPTNPELYS